MTDDPMRQRDSGVNGRDVILGKVVEALKPTPHDTLDEATLNAALAIIESVHCRSELEALIAVEIVATGFSGLRFLRQSQQAHDGRVHQCVRQLRQQAANGPCGARIGNLKQGPRPHRRGHKQTMEVRHVHIHSGARGSSKSSTRKRIMRPVEGKIDRRPHASG